MSKLFRPWAFWRRLQYGFGFGMIWVLIGAFVYFNNFYTGPSCLDGRFNGTEDGVDCGGACVQICPAQVLPPRVVWAESFKIADGQYNVVAYVENPNQTAATPELHYTFTLKSGGAVVAERAGTTILPPNSVYPIFEGRVFTDGDADIDETLVLLDTPDLWLPASTGRDQFRASDIKLTNADERPRLDVDLENTDLRTAENVEVVATIFNERGEPVTASQTLEEKIEARDTKEIVFTWPSSIAKTVKSCIIPTDVAMAIDLSGSMNNDGDEPPQPVTDALAAAGQFANTLGVNDQVAVITFATKAAITTPLTTPGAGVVSEIEALTIDPAEETGYTNTVAALMMAQSELNSTRHNLDARRVLVMLTDGLPTTAGDADIVGEAISTAFTLQEDDIEVYAIGLGENVDASFIRGIASEAENAYFAPTSADLNRIYAEITSSLCEAGPTKIDIIPKSTTNFAVPHK